MSSEHFEQYFKDWLKAELEHNHTTEKEMLAKRAAYIVLLLAGHELPEHAQTLERLANQVYRKV